VQRDRTVSLNGVVYEVDAALVGEKVIVRFDPSAPPVRGVDIWHAERFIARATPVDAYANCFVRRQRPTQMLEPDVRPPAPPRSRLALRELDDHDPTESR